MATYECSKCGMSVNATCGKCNEPLIDDMLNIDDGTQDGQTISILNINDNDLRIDNNIAGDNIVVAGYRARILLWYSDSWYMVN